MAARGLGSANPEKGCRWVRRLGSRPAMTKTISNVCTKVEVGTKGATMKSLFFSLINSDSSPMLTEGVSRDGIVGIYEAEALEIMNGVPRVGTDQPLRTQLLQACKMARLLMTPKGNHVLISNWEVPLKLVAGLNQEIERPGWAWTFGSGPSGRLLVSEAWGSGSASHGGSWGMGRLNEAANGGPMEWAFANVRGTDDGELRSVGELPFNGTPSAGCTRKLLLPGLDKDAGAKAEVCIGTRDQPRMEKAYMKKMNRTPSLHEPASD